MHEYQEEQKDDKKPLFELPLKPNLDGFRDKSYLDDDKPYEPPAEEVY